MNTARVVRHVQNECTRITRAHMARANVSIFFRRVLFKIIFIIIIVFRSSPVNLASSSTVRGRVGKQHYASTDVVVITVINHGSRRR